MTPDDLNRQCAERMGWKHLALSAWLDKHGHPKSVDFATSHDAAHTLLSDLSEEEWENFVEWLLDLLGASVADGDYERKILTATPAQLCAAYLAATEGRAK